MPHPLRPADEWVNIAEAIKTAGLPELAVFVHALGLGWALPRRQRWRQMPASAWALLWLEATELAEDIEHAIRRAPFGVETRNRHIQLSLLRDLKEDLTTLIERDAASRDWQKAQRHLLSLFKEGEKVIGDQLPAIAVEAHRR